MGSKEVSFKGGLVDKMMNLNEEAKEQEVAVPLQSILRGTGMSKKAMSGLSLSSYGDSDTGAGTGAGVSNIVGLECGSCGLPIGNDSHFTVKCRHNHSLCNGCFSESLIHEPPRCAGCDCKFEEWNAVTKRKKPAPPEKPMVELTKEEEEAFKKGYETTEHMTAIMKQLSPTPVPIDEPCMVTGATGYIAGQIIKDLLEAGAIVHATVRDIEYDAERFEHLEKIAADSPGTLKIFEADLMDEGSFEDAIKDCVYVFHCASPYPDHFIRLKKVREELLDPAVVGTSNVCEEANKSETVQRIVLTSSVYACMTDAKDVRESKEGRLTETVWNNSASRKYQPYAYSKLMAEKKAWKIQKAGKKWDLVRILPGVTVGPGVGIQHHSTSVNLIKSLGDGTYKKEIPPISIPICDIREVSKCHLEAAFRPEAKGRYLCVKERTDLFELSQILAPKYGEKYFIPRKSTGKLKFKMFGPFRDRRFDRKYISRTFDMDFPVDSSKTEKELGVKFRPTKWSVLEHFEQLIEEGLVEPKKKKGRNKRSVKEEDLESSEPGAGQ